MLHLDNLLSLAPHPADTVNTFSLAILLTLGLLLVGGASAATIYERTGPLGGSIGNPLAVSSWTQDYDATNVSVSAVYVANLAALKG
ncbi:MAG: hypothetical protein ABIZ80_16660, partial [Bryobacteraceae bacterium]